MKYVVVYIENLSKLSPTRTSISCVDHGDAEQTALAVVQSRPTHNLVVEMGDVITVNERRFLVEADNTLTEMESDEYKYYKSIDPKERIFRWFSWAIQ